jgi:ribonuclease HI
MVEPVVKFVQCFGVSKRPDQYIRLVCGTDRIRVWRLNEAPTEDQDPVINKKLTNDITQLIEDHSRVSQQMKAEKINLEKKLQTLIDDKRLRKEVTEGLQNEMKEL